MMLSVLLAIQSIFATPVDLLDKIYAQKGWAFVPASNRRVTMIVEPRKRDSVVLGNTVRRWNLSYRPEKAIVTAIALPMRALFPSETYVQNRYRRIEPKEFARTLSARSGRVLRVRELLENAGIPADRCHWIFWDRLVLARVLPSRLTEAMPDLATTLGGRYDSRKRRIEFDPYLFRKLLIKSVDENDEPYVTGQPSPWPLALLAVNSLNDSQLSSVYADFKPKLIEIPLIGGRTHSVVEEYIQKRMQGMKGEINGLFSNLDPKTPPKIEYFPLNVVSVRLTKRDGSAIVF